MSPSHRAEYCQLDEFKTCLLNKFCLRCPVKKAFEKVILSLYIMVNYLMQFSLCGDGINLYIIIDVHWL